jgi:hypothetical protein
MRLRNLQVMQSWSLFRLKRKDGWLVSTWHTGSQRRPIPTLYLLNVNCSSLGFLSSRCLHFVQSMVTATRVGSFSLFAMTSDSCARDQAASVYQRLITGLHCRQHTAIFARICFPYNFSEKWLWEGPSLFKKPSTKNFCTKPIGMTIT